MAVSPRDNQAETRRFRQRQRQQFFPYLGLQANIRREITVISQRRAIIETFITKFYEQAMQIFGYTLVVPFVTTDKVQWQPYSLGNGPDLAFVQVLHQTADYLAQQRDVKVISFVALLKGDIPLL